MAPATLRRTPLHDHHRRLGARLVDFHGWELPVQYEGIIKEHQAVRAQCGVFDVSHMGRVWVTGQDAAQFLERVNTNKVDRGPGKAVYSHLANEKGGVVDDVIVSCLAPGRFLVVVNAATREKDWEWLRGHVGASAVVLEDRSDDTGMIAIQGPKAAAVVALDFPEVQKLPKFGALERRIFDSPAVVTRTGYTGEDGFEFIVPREVISRLWDNLLTKGRSWGIRPCGLGARDTLRLEAGLLLYGQDLDDEHSPLEAGYDWVVKFDKGDFIGREALLGQRGGVSRRRVGVRLSERGVPRPGCAVTLEGRRAGVLDSGTFSPTLQAGIGAGYLEGPVPPGTALSVEIHGRQVPAQSVALPFYKREASNAKS